MTGWHLFRKESYQPRSVLVLAFLTLCGGSLFAAETSATPGTTGYEVITLTNITSERGKELLGRLKLGTVSKLPGGNTLLVTAEPASLHKAHTVLNLVDSRTEFEIKELGPAADRPLPSSAQIAAAVNGMSIGTFAHPPQDKTKMRAIVDVHNGMIVAIAPVIQMRDIKFAVDLSCEALRQARAGNDLPVGQTVQATAMLASSLASETADAARKETSTEAQPLAQSSAKPEPVAPANPQPTNSTPAETQTTAQPAEPAPAAQPTTETAAPATTKEPVAAEPVPVQPEPTAASSVTPVTETTPQTPAEATPVAAQASAVPPAQASGSPFRPIDMSDGDKVLDLTLPERMPVIYLLDLVGKQLGLSYVYNPDDVKGEVTLKLNGDLHGSVRVKDLYPLLEQSLRQLNLITTRHKGNVVAIVPTTRVMEIDPPLIDRSVPSIESGNTAITCKFELKYIDTMAAKNLIEGMKLNLDPVIAVPEKHIIMVTTYAYRMERVERLLQMVDQPGEPKKFQFKQLRYTMAKTLADKVKAMAEQMLDSVSVTVAESEQATPSLARQPGENDIAYRTRVAAYRQQQAQQQAALRVQQAALRAQVGAGAETKPGVYLDADERTNRVLMIGAEKQLKIVEDLVEALDVQQQDLRALQLYRIKHVDAEDVARKLMELGIISRLPDGSTASSRYPNSPTRITQPQPGQPRPTTPQAPEVQLPTTTEVTEKGLVEEPQVVVVEATNSLLVNATAEQHAKIAHIVEYVDSETETTEIPYKIYPLENSSPKSLAEILQSLIQDTIEQQKEGGKIEKVVVNRDDKIKIVPDPNTYSLIVYGNKKNQEWISSLITQLDKRRPQVLIDVTLVSITKNDKFDYDLNLIRSSPDLNSTSGVTGVSSTDKTLGRALQIGGNGLTAFYGDNQIQALLDTVQSKTYGRVLAKPKLLVNDNEMGKVDTKDTTYVETTSALPVASGVPGTTGGLVQTSTTWQNYDAGVTLEITPHISEGELLRLDIKLTRSDFGALLGNRPPDKKSSEVDTGVTLPSGTTVILGGMLKMNQTKGGSKVPILGDIPLVGGLFRNIHNSQVDENLYMFVKAEIIRPDETSRHGMKGLEDLSERNRQAYEKKELEFQRQEDWPGLRSQPISPVKALDEQ